MSRMADSSAESSDSEAPSVVSQILGLSGSDPGERNLRWILVLFVGANCRVGTGWATSNSHPGPSMIKKWMLCCLFFGKIGIPKLS